MAVAWRRRVVRDGGRHGSHGDGGARPPAIRDRCACPGSGCGAHPRAGLRRPAPSDRSGPEHLWSSGRFRSGRGSAIRYRQWRSRSAACSASTGHRRSHAKRCSHETDSCWTAATGEGGNSDGQIGAAGGRANSLHPARWERSADGARNLPRPIRIDLSISDPASEDDGLAARPEGGARSYRRHSALRVRGLPVAAPEAVLSKIAQLSTSAARSRVASGAIASSL